MKYGILPMIKVILYVKLWYERFIGGDCGLTSEKLREDFIQVLKDCFPDVKYKISTLKSGNTRISPYLPNKKRNKRWMQLDANPTHFSIVMDYKAGDIKEEDINFLHLPTGLNGCTTAITLQKNNDAINLSIFTTDPYNFINKEFIHFLHKHYKSYLKLLD
jgi:hypothetical protein